MSSFIRYNGEAIDVMTLVYATARRGNQSPVMFSHIYYFRKSGRLIGPIVVSFIFPVCIASKIATRRKFYRLPSLTVARRDDGRMETLRATRCQREREREGASERASDSGRGRVRGKGRGRAAGSGSGSSSSRRGFCRACGDVRNPHIAGSVHWRIGVTRAR